MRPHVRRWIKRSAIAIVVLAIAPVLALIACAFATPLPEELAAGPTRGSVRILDRHGHLLREVRDDDGARARWVTVAEVGPHLPAALIAAEDRRFRDHRGVDLVASARAALSNVLRMRVVSGASTLTMQLARTLRPHDKNLRGKFVEAALALRIEASLSKDRILEEYLNRVSFGPNLRGVAAASEAYFGKGPAQLSLAEAALLAGVVRGPSFYAPDRHASRAAERRAVVLRRMVTTGAIDETARAIAEGEPIVTRTVHASAAAPHFVRGLLAGGVRALQPGLEGGWPKAPVSIATTLDRGLQREVEAIVRAKIAALAAKEVTAAAVVVIENATGDVLAWVGSPDAFDTARLGANDGVLAKRQPGSTLKPFLYGLAFETRGYGAATLVPDLPISVPTAAGIWSPQNYDGKWRGPVRVREALGNSLNAPAVATVLDVGVAPFLERLRALGFASLDRDADHYGPALALGDGEVRLVELANAYAALARGGIAKPVRVVRSLAAADGERTFEPGLETRVGREADAALLLDVLADPRARLASFGDATALDFPFAVAAKTGTSKGFRDNWAVGSSTAVTVAVWVGNFDGRAMHGVSGITGAGPIFHATMEAAMRARSSGSLPIAATDVFDGDPDARFTKVEICALSGERATALCPHRVREWLPIRGAPGLPSCTHHVGLRVDRRNGLRAGPGCRAEETETRVFEDLPPTYVAWATDAKRPLPPVESSPFCPADDRPARGDALVIRTPVDGIRYVIDPDRPRDLQVATIEVVAPEATTEVTLEIDGATFAKRRRPFVFAWPLSEGAHVATAKAAGAEPSAPVRLTVRGGS
jgi:penicillin-binding protein 1C